MIRRGDTTVDVIIHISIFILFFSLMFVFVNSYSNGSDFLENFYSKEISKMINNAEPGMEFKIDISKLAVVALKNGKPLKDIVAIDNVKNQVIVSSRLNSGTSFSFFNDVDVVDFYVEEISGSSEATRFIFKIKEKQRNEA